MSASRTKALQALAEPVVAQFDVDLEEVVVRQAGRRLLVRVVVDAAQGLTLDLVASISRAVSEALDDSSILGNGPYVLEVTSPGVDRPLRLPRHWQRAVGRMVRVTNRSGDIREGRLIQARPAAVLMEADGVRWEFDPADVSRAVVQVEFSHVEDAQLDEVDDRDRAEPDEDPGSGSPEAADQED